MSDPNKSGKYTVRIDRREEPKGRAHLTLEVNVNGMRQALDRIKDLNIRLFTAKEEVALFERLGASPEYLAQRRKGIAEHEKERQYFRECVAEGIRVLTLRDELEEKGKTPAQRAQEQAAATVHQMLTGCKGAMNTVGASYRKGLAEAESYGDGNSPVSRGRRDEPAPTPAPTPAAKEPETPFDPDCDSVGKAIAEAFGGPGSSEPPTPADPIATADNILVMRDRQMEDAVAAAVDEAQG